MSSTQNSGWTSLPPSRNAEWNERFASRPPHVFVGICSFGEIPHEIYHSHMLWAFRQGAICEGRFAISFGMSTRSEQYRARNKLIRAAQQEGADFLLMIDDDQTLHSCVDIIDKFWELGQSIAAGLYYNRGGLYWPIVMKILEADDPRCEAYFYFLRNLDPSLADHVLLDAGRKFKAARKWNRAVQCLKQLAATDLFDADIRYDLSVANLKLSPKDLGLHLRGDDHALRAFQALLADKHVPLMDRLVKDKTLDASDLFFVGFHFAEGHGPERDFGTKFLEHVVKKWPASNDGKAAKNKLKLAAQPAPRVT